MSLINYSCDSFFFQIILILFFNHLVAEEHYCFILLFNSSFSNYFTGTLRSCLKLA